MPISPMNPYPEKSTSTWERSVAPAKTGNRGPLRFEEGVATETDVPKDFGRGAYQDTAGNSRGYQTQEHVFKRAEETMRERAHIGSASWVEAPALLSDFVAGTGSGDRGTAVGGWERAINSGAHQARPNKMRVSGW
jgi:hypothetical protein